MYTDTSTERLQDSFSTVLHLTRVHTWGSRLTCDSRTSTSQGRKGLHTEGRFAPCTPLTLLCAFCPSHFYYYHFQSDLVAEPSRLHHPLRPPKCRSYQCRPQCQNTPQPTLPPMPMSLLWQKQFLVKGNYVQDESRLKWQLQHIMTMQ